jgi:ribosomal RNA methyltransferase Nop2
LPHVSPKSKKSKQTERPKKIIPTQSDASSTGDEDEDDEPVTMANMAHRSRRLEAQAAAEAELDLEEAQADALQVEDEDLDMDADEDANGDMDIEPFHLPTASELEQEKASGGPDVHLVQRRIRECVRVLAKFTRRAEKGR